MPEHDRQRPLIRAEGALKQILHQAGEAPMAVQRRDAQEAAREHRRQRHRDDA
jgi:hypothetical protein